MGYTDRMRDGLRIFLKKGIYQVEVERNLRRSLKTRDPREARIRAKEVEREYLKGRLVLLERQNNMTLGQLFDEFGEWLSNNRAASTAKTWQEQRPKLLASILATKSIVSISTADIDAFTRYCRARKNANPTINIGIRYFKWAMAYAAEKKYIPGNPFAGRKKLQLPVHKNHSIIEDKDDVAKLFAAVEKTQSELIRRRDRILIALYVYTGARRSEIASLEWRDVKKDRIVFRNRKNYEQNDVPIVAPLHAILGEFDHSNSIGRIVNMREDGVSKRVKHYLRLAGLGHMRPHELRHSFGSHLLMQGVDLKTVQLLMGHSSPVTTSTIYAHVLKKHVKEAINNLPY